MKATLEFNLPEEEREYRIANQSADMYAVICHLAERLRSYRKHGNDFENVSEALDTIHTILYDELDARHINIHD
jgi:hypothetical protein